MDDTLYRRHLDKLYESTREQLWLQERENRSLFHSMNMAIDAKGNENDALMNEVINQKVLQLSLESRLRDKNKEMEETIDYFEERLRKDQRRAREKIQRLSHLCEWEKTNLTQDFKNSLHKMNRENNNLYISLLESRDNKAELQYENSLLRDRIYEMTETMTTLTNQLSHMKMSEECHKHMASQILALQKHLNSLVDYVIGCSQGDAVQIKSQKERISSLEQLLNTRMREISDLERECNQNRETIREKDKEIERLNALYNQLTVLYEYKLNQDRK